MTDSTKTDLKQVPASRRRAIAPALSDDLLERTSLSVLNRLVRTRMLGGVGRAVSNDCPYPIRFRSHERTRNATSSFSTNALIDSKFFRITCSTSAVVQLPSLTHTTFGGNPKTKLRW